MAEANVISVPMQMERIVEHTVEKVCKQFCLLPYLSHAVHGLQAQLYHELMQSIPPGQLYAEWKGQKVGMIQKNYRTASKLGKARSQHWDVAVLDSPLTSLLHKSPGYDFFRLNSVVEFELNARPEHLADILARLSHKDSNAINKHVVHLYRLSASGHRISGMDLSPDSDSILPIDTVMQMLEQRRGSGIIVHYALWDKTKTFETQAWRLEEGLEPVNIL
jgi:hypothetical protein